MLRNGLVDRLDYWRERRVWGKEIADLEREKWRSEHERAVEDDVLIDPERVRLLLLDLAELAKEASELPGLYTLSKVAYFAAYIVAFQGTSGSDRIVFGVPEAAGVVITAPVGAQAWRRGMRDGRRDRRRVNRIRKRD
jgi:hypothetical protein